MEPLSRRDLEMLRTIIEQRLGLVFDADRLDELGTTLRTRMEKCRSPNAAVYARELSSPTELRALAEVLTIGETYFLRNADQFRALREHVLPDRIRAQSASRRLRILSAGSSSGEEAYSIAIVLREILPDHASWHIDIVGIDVNPAAIARARAARYSEWSLRQTSDAFRDTYFRRVGSEYVLNRDIVDAVTFEERNLVVDDPAFFRPGSFDVVLCRNVTMYFAPEITRLVIGRLAAALAPDGYLFLGHAETLRGISHDFHLRHTHDTFYYQLRDVTAPRVFDAIPSTEAVPMTVVTPDPASTSWIEAIRRASERIEALGGTQRVQRSVTTPVPRRTQVLARALELLHQERFADALEALGSDTGDADAELLRAVLLANSGRLAEAELVCAALLELDELNASAHYVTALCREHAGNVASAIEHDQAAAYLDATFAMPHLHLGLLAKRANDRAAAIRELEIAVVLLEREDASRVLLLGGGFSREALVILCRSELRALRGGP